MIEVKNLTKKYGKKTILDNVSVKCEDGTITALLANNGEGKSTLIKSICGLISSDMSLLLSFDDKVIDKTEIGYIPENNALYSYLTVKEHIYLVSNAYGKEIDKEYYKSLLKLFKIEKYENKIINTLSKGTTTKVSIIMNLVRNPKILLLDEPFYGLDQYSIDTLKEILINLKNKRITILISTHIYDLVKDIADKVLYLENGRIKDSV